MTKTLLRIAISAADALAGCILVALRGATSWRRKLRAWGEAA